MFSRRNARARDAARPSVSRLALGVLVALVGAIAPLAANADAERSSTAKSVLRITDPTSLPTSRRVEIGLHKSMIVELPVDVRDILVSDPATVDAVVLTARRVYVLAKELGSANLFFLSKDGQKQLILDVTVHHDLSELREQLRQLLPGARLKVAASGTGLMLSGAAATPLDASRAEEIAAQYVKKSNIVNLINVAAKEQVLLKVIVTEMQRNAIRRLGVNLPEALAKAGSFTFAKVIQNGLPASGASVPPTVFAGPGQLPAVAVGSALQASANWNGNNVSALIESLERTGLSRTLAEPNLTAISGETAKFLAGGEFPVPVAVQNNAVSVSWKSFGVSISFTPFVVTEGRINLKVSAEVSELSTNGSVTISGFALPGVQVRRAETTVEMPSGSALAIAGLLSDQTRQNVDGVPELKNLPVLGALFRSRDYQRNETELVVIVTPYVVKSAEPGELSKPDEGFAPASGLQGLFLGYLHRVYGEPGHVPAGSYRGDYGFIIDYPADGDSG